MKICYPFKMWRNTRTAFLLLVIPAVEFSIFRYFLKRVLNLPVGWTGLGITDWDLIFPVLVAHLVLMNVFLARSPLAVRPQRKTITANLFFCLLFLATSIFLKVQTVPASNLLWKLWWCHVPFVFGTAFFVLAPPRYFLFHPNRRFLLPCFLVAFTVPLHQLTTAKLWPWLAPFTGNVSLISLRLLFADAISYEFVGGKLQILHPDFIITMNEGCAGAEGILLFALLFSYLFLFSRSRFTAFGWLAAFGVGSSLMFFLNILRIVLFFSFGIMLQRKFGGILPITVCLTLFHSHIGWILYLGGTLTYIRLLTSKFYLVNFSTISRKDTFL